MSEINKEDVQAALNKAEEVLIPKVEEAKTRIETDAKSNPWPLLAGAFVVGGAVGSVLGWLLG